MNAFEDDLPALNSAPIGQATKTAAATETTKEKATRKPRPKLDYDRLLKGPKGFAHLRTHTKFTLQSRLTGKPGHETADLAEIVTFFQEWAKLLFPKATLTEFLKKVEDLCDSKLMKDYLHEMKINPNGDGTDFMANRHLREAKAEVEKLELMEEDFDVTAALAAVQPKTSNNKSTGRGKEVADEDESLETSSEDDVGDHGSDLDDFINDASEDEEEAAHSDEAEAEAEETETESETEESTIDKSAKRAKMAIVASDNEETGTPIPKKTLTFASDEEEATETNTARSATQSSKPKNNAIIFSDDE